ncbi:hypothetical protein OKA05_20630 [Luteolibacter arcticus]|uniref:Uncharacterized protein n=1 Tax=Luteolibacter arcticus TaxID=1581411 RepID=A0ABT3GN84_9BACT|nr:hypothetical protein [Luteolibacter arcticus]MCW1924981.1 hypothetical protein [Luteolibacter arcticus]
MPAFLQALCAALILLTGIASAHGGYESETEVRVFPDRMRIVVRTSLPFAWKILGNRAPAATDEAGQATAKPLLATAAASLFEVTAGGATLTPSKSDCVFEVHDLHDHAAFTLDFPRPAASPVAVKATFFPLLGELDTGTIAVFDQSASRFQRDVEPLLKTSISGEKPGITFDLGAPAASSPPAAPASSPPIPAQTPAARPFPLPIAVAIAFLIIGVIGFLWKRYHNRAGA